MSECKGEGCTHSSHKPSPIQQKLVKQMQDKQTPEESAPRNPIITPSDPERFPLLEMASQTCDIPLSHADEQAIIDMDTILEALDEEAAGLAAVQIGVPRRIFLLRNGTNSDGTAINNVYINPTIVSRSRETKKSGEGCLSLPGMGAAFPRSKTVTLEYMDLGGEFHTEIFTGFWSRAVQHEIDHLNGILLTSHLEKQLTKQPSRTSFGMKKTPHRTKIIATRRVKKKKAQAINKRKRAIGR